VEVLGIDVAMDIVDYCGGSMLYFPSKRSAVRCARNRVIRSEFNGANYRELAIMFEISEMQVRNIVKGIEYTLENWKLMGDTCLYRIYNNVIILCSNMILDMYEHS
jgi:Mor family transcriptional regulator